MYYGISRSDNDRDVGELIAKKADYKMSFFNPRLQTRQEKKMIIVLSSDGKECIGIVENGKILKK